MTSSTKRAARALLLSLVVLELLVVGLIASISVFPRAAAPVAAVVRGSVCPASTLVDCWDMRERLFSMADSIREESRVVERDPMGFDLWETPHGSWWIPEGSADSAPIMLAQQVVDHYGNGKDTVQAGDVVLDGGAHVGFWVKEALERGARIVVAIEPAPSNVECLRRNFPEEIAEGRVVIYPRGIWDVHDELPLWEDPQNSGADGFILKGANFETRHVIPLVPIDALVEELSLERIDVIKMDIKGAVERALRGARQTLQRYHPKLIIAADEQEADEPKSIVALVDQLESGYRLRCSGCLMREDWSVSPDVMLMSWKR